MAFVRLHITMIMMGAFQAGTRERGGIRSCITACRICSADSLRTIVSFFKQDFGRCSFSLSPPNFDASIPSTPIHMKASYVSVHSFFPLLLSSFGSPFPSYLSSSLSWVLCCFGAFRPFILLHLLLLIN